MAQPTQAILAFLYDPYYDDAGLVEIVDEATSFVPSGQVTLSPSAGGFRGTLDGGLLLFAQVPTRGSGAHASCYSSSHQVALTR